jgi:hypothetical protein
VFDPTSRYFAIPDTTLSVRQPDGFVLVVAYKRRRLVRPASEAPTLTEHTFAQGERLDTLAARYLGDPRQFWRICDANEVIWPGELVEEVGRAIRIAMPSL